MCLIRAVSFECQKKLIEERIKDTPEESQNCFQPGDFVLHQRNPDYPLPTKLSSPYKGPCEVIQQCKNDVECRHLVVGNVTWLHVTRLKLIVGNREDAYKVALLDADQFVILKFIIGEEIPPSVPTCSSLLNLPTEILSCFHSRWI